MGQWSVNRKKTQFLLGLRQAKCPGHLISNLRELTNLRNWIVHGKVYRTALLIERDAEEPNSGTVRLRADDEEWAPRFPRFKFPMPDRLSYPDAREFLVGIAETLCFLGDAYKMPPILILGPPGSIKMVLLSADTDAMSTLSAYIDGM